MKTSYSIFQIVTVAALFVTVANSAPLSAEKESRSIFALRSLENVGIIDASAGLIGRSITSIDTTFEKRKGGKKGGKSTAPEAPAPAQPVPGSITLTDPTGGKGNQGNPDEVKQFLNPDDKSDQKKLNKGLENASSGGQPKSNLYKDDSLKMRLDRQNAPSDAKANIAVQKGDQSCATCVIHNDANPSTDTLKDALQQSADTGKNAHVWRRFVDFVKAL